MGRKSSPWICTYTGIKFQLLAPTVEQISRSDIAHALANYCRFGGHSDKFYSVAQHSILVSEYLREEGESVLVQLQGLLHDAPEAYIGDVVKPLKDLLPSISKIEKNILKAIYNKLNLPLPTKTVRSAIKVADEKLLITERNWLLPDSGVWWKWEPEPVSMPYGFKLLSPKVAEKDFLDKLHALEITCLPTK